MNNLISKIAAALAVVSFLFLPAAAGCGGEITGLKLIEADEVEPLLKVCLIAAMLCAVVIIIVKDSNWAVGFSVTGAVLMIGAYFIAKNKYGELIEPRYGSIISFGSFIAAAISSAVSGRAATTTAQTEAPVQQTTSAAETIAQTGICPACGKQNSTTDNFCVECGSKL